MVLIIHQLIVINSNETKKGLDKDPFYNFFI